MKQFLLIIFILSTLFTADAQSISKSDTALRNSKATVNSQPFGLELKQNYPNPFNKSTKIEFAATEAHHVEFKVYDMLGHIIISKIIDCHTGINSIIVERDGLAPGFYFYSIQSGNTVQTKRFMIKDL